ncbi:MAG: hypothetical protein K2G87_06295, partial [Oscillospiraceae bacterium]|nr:hypothetical protein [Oscillospiraceae bacterium]
EGKGRGEKEREGKPVRGEGEGGSASLKSPRAPPPLHGRVVPRTSPSKVKIMFYLKYPNKVKSKFTTFIDK